MQCVAHYAVCVAHYAVCVAHYAVCSTLCSVSRGKVTTLLSLHIFITLCPQIYTVAFIMVLLIHIVLINTVREILRKIYK